MLIASVDWVPEPNTIHVSTAMRVLPLILTAIYMILPVALWGATLGKRIVGVEVIRARDGGPAGIEGAFMRYLPYLALSALSFVVARSGATTTTPYSGGSAALSGASILLPIVSLILVVTDSRRRSVFDRVGGTNVVVRKQ